MSVFALSLRAALGFVVSSSPPQHYDRRPQIAPPMHAPTPFLPQLSSADARAAPKPLPNMQSADARAAPKPLPNLQKLLSDALLWGLSRCANAEDVWLALVSPCTFRLLSEWRTCAFGDEARLRRKLQASCRQLDTRLDPALDSQITVRTKGLWSTFSKSAVRRQRVHDVLALRIVVEGDEAECLAALGEVQNSWPSLPGRAKNYVHLPKANGYQALHDTVLLPCGTPMEVQVRSKQMHWHAELGGASHRQYKGAQMLPARLLDAVAAPRLRLFGALRRP